LSPPDVRLKCIKIDFGDPAGFKPPTFKGKRGVQGRGGARVGNEKKKGRERWKGRKKGGRGEKGKGKKGSGKGILAIPIVCFRCR